MIKIFKKYLFPLQQLILTDFKLRYQNSILGYFWSLLKPLVLFLSIYTVFSGFLSSQIPNFPIYLLAGIILWNFFQESILIGIDTFQIRRDLILKLNFPKELLLLASMTSSLINLLINLLVFFLIFFFVGGHFSISFLLIVLVILILFTLSFSLTLILSVLNTKYRDIKYFTEIFLQILFWFTPVIYSPEILPENIRNLLAYNPLSWGLNSFRTIILSNSFNLQSALIWLFIISSILAISLFYFHKKSPTLAELI